MGFIEELCAMDDYSASCPFYCALSNAKLFTD